MEQSVLAVGFAFENFLRPGIWVYGETYGAWKFLCFTIENSNLKLSLKTPAVDYNPDIRWSPDNLKKRIWAVR